MREEYLAEEMNERDDLFEDIPPTYRDFRTSCAALLPLFPLLPVRRPGCPKISHHARSFLLLNILLS